MLLDSESLHTETNCNAKGNAFKISASPVAFDILCSKLYTNPILAIVRELLTNAYDSQKLAGKEDAHTYVHLPEFVDSNFVIRDYGVGLSKEDVLNMYTSFFTSTKSNNNDYTGCFGLGSKTPFSYTSTFSIISYYEGIRYTFIATKKDGYPHIYAVNEEPTEEENGLQITIPSDTSYGTYDRRFYTELMSFIKYVPEIKVKLGVTSNGGIEKKELEINEALVVSEDIKLYKENNFYSSTSIAIKQGQNVYKTSNHDVYEYGKKHIKLFAKDFTIVYEVPIGTLSIPPSREMLSKEGNEEKIVKIVQEVEEELQKYLKNNLHTLANTSSTFKTEWLKLENEKYFPNQPGRRLFGYPKICNGDYNEIYAVLGSTVNRLKGKIYSDTSNSAVYTDVTNIVITNNNTTTKDVEKLKRTIANYEELQEEHNIILVGISTEEDDSIYVEMVKQLKNNIWLLNNNPSYTFVIKHMTLKQFRKKYPNDKKQKISSSVKDSNPCIRVTSSYISKENFVRTYGKTTLYINDIKSKQHCKNTFIVYKDKNSYDTIVGFINILSNNIKPTKDKPLLKSLWNKLDGTLDNATNYPTMHIMEISKSNKKYFKEYQELSIPLLEEIGYKLANNIDLSVYYTSEQNKNVHPNPREDGKRKLTELKTFIDNLSSTKKKNTIKNSIFYKILETVSKVKCTQSSILQLNEGTKDYHIFTTILPKYKKFFKINTNNFYNSINTNKLLVLAEKVRLRYRMHEKEVFYTTDSSLVNKLLNLTKKGQTNVLFQR